MPLFFLTTVEPNILDFIGRLYEAFRTFWENFGEYGLFIYSVIETITPIAGVEVFFVTLIHTGGKPWWRIALIATVANVIGSIIVYFFMAKEDSKFYNRVLKKEQQLRAQKLFTRYGVWAIFIFSMTPLPFFIIIFTAAIARMKFKQYAVAVFFSRGTRFFITTYIFHRFTGVSPLMLVLILILIALPLSVFMMYGQRKLLEYFENRANDGTETTEENA